MSTACNWRAQAKRWRDLAAGSTATENASDLYAEAIELHSDVCDCIDFIEQGDTDTLNARQELLEATMHYIIATERGMIGRVKA